MNGLPEAVDLHSYQQRFAARVRNPQGESLPEWLPEKRMRVYEELLFNNLESFLLACYPITRNILSENQWADTVRQFFIDHRCQSPLFRDIPGEFLGWMEKRAVELFPEKPFLHDFMHYEWLELAVSIADIEAEQAKCDPDGDLLSGKAVLNPTAELAYYAYPVHRIGPDFQPLEPDGQTYCYLLFRDENHKVQFIVLNPITARLVEHLNRGLTGIEAIHDIADEINHPDINALLKAGREQLAELHQRGVITGTKGNGRRKTT